MSLMINYNESFYDILLKYSVKLIDMTSNIFELVAVVVLIVVVSYTFYHVHEYYYKRYTRGTNNVTGSQTIKDYNRSFVRCRSIINHKEMLHNLECAADKCHTKHYALRCIDIIVYCPQLLNIKSPLNGLTPFHRICFNGHTCLIAFTLAKGADPFITTVTGENALCMAVYYFLNNPAQDDFSCLEILHKTGCKFGMKNRWYNILLKMAFTINHMKLAQWLVLHNKISTHKTLRCSSTPPLLKNYKFN